MSATEMLTTTTTTSHLNDDDIDTQQWCSHKLINNSMSSPILAQQTFSPTSAF